MIMARSRFSNSVRKFVRREKARIRRAVADSADQERQIAVIVERLKKECVRQHKDTNYIASS